ncbi:uncharacterized protein G2W53_012091 [Senna tora]|uniref:Uncharacterized protein n=1 Tax=Senna tora TaxID=362788 RepID=A0A834WQF9_9FABA|nr:uncharacterized protein G2W53_012091 [Senna tora]
MPQVLNQKNYTGQWSRFDPHVSCGPTRARTKSWPLHVPAAPAPRKISPPSSGFVDST